jgi:two-component system, response regulator
MRKVHRQERTDGAVMKRVLYIDDSADDLMLFGRGCELAGVSFVLTIAHGSEVGVRYLESAGELADQGAHPMPDLILLDIKMPGMDGFEVLSWIRAQAKFSMLPVALYSSSTVSEDVLRGYLGGTTFYVPKPSGLAALKELALAVDNCLKTEGKECDALLKLSIERATVMKDFRVVPVSQGYPSGRVGL